MSLKDELQQLDGALTDALNSGDPPDLRKVWTALYRLREVMRTIAARFPI